MPHLLLVWRYGTWLESWKRQTIQGFLESHFLCRLISLLHSFTFTTSDMIIAFCGIKMVESGMRDRFGSPSIVQGISQVFLGQNDVFLSHDAFYHHQCLLRNFFAVSIVCTVVVGMLRAHAMCLAHSLSELFIFFIFSSVVVAFLSSPQFSLITLKFGY